MSNRFRLILSRFPGRRLRKQQQQKQQQQQQQEIDKNITKSNESIIIPKTTTVNQLNDLDGKEFDDDIQNQNQNPNQNQTQEKLIQIEIDGICYIPKIISINNLLTKTNTIDMQRDSISIFEFRQSETQLSSPPSSSPSSTNQQYLLIVNIYPDFNVSLAEFETLDNAINILHTSLVNLVNMFVPFFRNFG